MVNARNEGSLAPRLLLHEWKANPVNKLVKKPKTHSSHYLFPPFLRFHHQLFLNYYYEIQIVESLGGGGGGGGGEELL